MSDRKNSITLDIRKKTKNFWSDFKKFITKGNIIDLAVAVIIGGAFSKIVTSLVNSIITPLTGLFIRSGDLANLKWVITPEITADEAAGISAVPEVAVKYGIFLQNIIDFLVIAFIIFLFLRIIIRAKNGLNRKEIEATEAKTKSEEEKKKADASAAAARIAEEESIRRQFYTDVAAQSKTLEEIRDIMLRIEKQNKL